MEDILTEEIVQLESELTKLKSAVEYIETAKISIEAASKITNTILKLKEEFEGLSQKALGLVNKIDKVDFPGRFDKADSRLSSLISQFQELQPRIEANNKAFMIESKNLSKSVLGSVSDSKNSIITQLENQSKEIKLITIGTIATFSVLVIFIVLSFLHIV
jgi:cell division protein ZapA (FtsZ GTPase activity inhibitor)